MLYVIRQSEVQIFNIEIIHESVRKLCVCTRQLFIAAATAALGLPLLLAATLMWNKIFLLLSISIFEIETKTANQLNYGLKFDGFHLHLLVFSFVYQFNSRILALVSS